MIKYPEEIKMDGINRTLAARKHRSPERRQVANNCGCFKNGGTERRVNIRTGGEQMDNRMAKKIRKIARKIVNDDYVLSLFWVKRLLFKDRFKIAIKIIRGVKKI